VDGDKGVRAGDFDVGRVLRVLVFVEDVRGADEELLGRDLEEERTAEGVPFFVLVDCVEWNDVARGQILCRHFVLVERNVCWCQGWEFLLLHGEPAFFWC
jgi:hypothetical protein